MSLNLIKTETKDQQQKSDIKNTNKNNDIHKIHLDIMFEDGYRCILLFNDQTKYNETLDQITYLLNTNINNISSVYVQFDENGIMGNKKLNEKKPNINVNIGKKPVKSESFSKKYNSVLIKSPKLQSQSLVNCIIKSNHFIDTYDNISIIELFKDAFKNIQDAHIDSSNSSIRIYLKEKVKKINIYQSSLTHYIHVGRYRDYDHYYPNSENIDKELCPTTYIPIIARNVEKNEKTLISGYCRTNFSKVSQTFFQKEKQKKIKENINKEEIIDSTTNEIYYLYPRLNI